MRKLLLLWLIIGVTTAFLYALGNDIIHTPHKVSESLIIQIKRGDSLAQIAKMLQENNLIEKDTYFILYAKIKKLYPRIKAGEYLVEDDISLANLADLLADGKIYLRKITFAEGLTAREIAEILYAEDMLDGDFEMPKEGNFLPETYTFSRGETRQKIVEHGQAAMKNVLQQAWDERDADLPFKNKEELLVLASIIEKETGVASERPQVASVFVNRLKKGMLLQTDPTVIYALTKGQTDLNRSLTYRDLAVDNPYNTYKYAGLPPSPICNPGKASIFAAAHPDKTPYLYFVASGNGGHNFAKSLQEHNINVKKWRALKK
ncbi:MAG: endolytic transglycosylase MltG [Alphaproteobacteria bacterium]|nr:endolytic transglycosylase MltG [Alphaproteobacteria bacterium]